MDDRIVSNLSGKSIPEYMDIINSIQPAPAPTFSPNFDQFQISTFYQYINNIEMLNDKDRHNFIKCNIDLISKHVVDNTCKYIRKLAEPVFLDVYRDVLGSMPITAVRRLAANKLCYSYQFAKRCNKEVQRKMFAISRIVNSQYIDALKSIGLNDEAASYLAMARFSSSDEMVNVNRLNYCIYTMGNELDEQKIIWIFEKLFDQMRYLFTGSMLETKDSVLPPENAEEDQFYESFSIVSLAILTMANNMPLTDINRLIYIYLDQWNAVGRPSVRFSLNALSGDFGRIRTVVEGLQEKFHLEIP